jgi:hypothetical protein
MTSVSVDAAIKELESFDEIVRGIVDLDYLLVDARSTASLRTLIDRLQFVYFSKRGILPFLLKLQKSEPIEDHEWKDIAFNFELERESVAKAADVMQRHMSDLKARFGAEISDFLAAIVDLKFAVRTVIEDMRTALRKDTFAAPTLATGAQTAAALVPPAQALKGSVAAAIEKLDAYEPV